MFLYAYEHWESINKNTMRIFQSIFNFTSLRRQGSHFRWNNGALSIVDLELLRVNLASLGGNGNTETVILQTNVQVKKTQKFYRLKLYIPTEQEEAAIQQTGKTMQLKNG